MRSAALFALALLGGCRPSLPILHGVPNVAHPELVRPGTAGTVSVLADSPGGCRLLRSEPGTPEVEVNQFPFACPDMSLHWSRTGERAVAFFYDTVRDSNDALEVDLVNGRFWWIIPPGGERVLTGYMSPEGAITLKTATPNRRGWFLRGQNAFGIGQQCDPGLFRAYRSPRNGVWEHVDDAELDCNGAVVGDWSLGDDFTWHRPGVVHLADDSRARGDYAVLGRQRIGPDGAEPPFSRGRIEFWPAPVLPEWPVEDPLQGDEW